MAGPPGLLAARHAPGACHARSALVRARHVLRVPPRELARPRPTVRSESAASVAGDLARGVVDRQAPGLASLGLGRPGPVRRRVDGLRLPARLVAYGGHADLVAAAGDRRPVLVLRSRSDRLAAGEAQAS